MQDLCKSPEPPPGDAIHEIGKIQQDPSRTFVPALVRDAVQAYRSPVLDELVDQGKLLVFSVRR